MLVVVLRERERERERVMRAKWHALKMKGNRK